MRKWVLFVLLILLMACREDAPAVVETAVPPTNSATAVSTLTPTNLPAPAVEESVVANTAVPPTATSTPDDPNSLNSIIEQVEKLEAAYLAAFPPEAGWLYYTLESYDSINSEGELVTYRGLADTWILEIWTEVSPEDTISRQVMLVYDTEGGLWERSALVEDTSVRVLPEQTVDGWVIALDEPLLFRTPHQDLIPILREIERGLFYEHTITAWEEDGRYHLQIDTLYNSPILAEENTTGQSLNGGKMHFVFDMETGELRQQQNWTVNGAGEETLHSDAKWSGTAVVAELPPLAAQTLVDATDLLAQTQNP
ncbi:MAG: hypothetical protein IPM53_23945 [Anaerolineaceae bacterium]|nr:hypothetical protein [Anaerolineaceae bacterium]